MYKRQLLGNEHIRRPFREQEHAGQIRIQYGVEFFSRRFQKRLVELPSGIVHHNVQLPVCTGRRVQGRLHIGFISHIAQAECSFASLFDNGFCYLMPIGFILDVYKRQG